MKASSRVSRVIRHSRQLNADALGIDDAMVGGSSADWGIESATAAEMSQGQEP